MYARLQTSHSPAPPAGQLDRLVDTLTGHPGFAGLYLAQHVDGGSGVLLTLWHTYEDARRAPERTAAQLGPRPVTLTRDDVYEVIADWHGLATGERPGAASILRFDGPFSNERLAAFRRANTERIAPAAAVPGGVRALELWDPAARASVVCILATTPEALRASADAAMSTDLLPGEDPALLPDVDHMDHYRVLASTLEGALR